MYLSLLKKELIQFFRTKSNIIMLFVFPIVLITTLSFGLKDLMSNTTELFGSDDSYSIVYYSVEDNKYKDGFIAFTKAVSESVNIKFEEVSNLDSVKVNVDNYEGIAHITVANNGFNYYSSSAGEDLSSKVFRSVFESMLNEYAVFQTILEENPRALTNLIENKFDEYVSKENASGLREVSAAEYYTFAELALIIFYISGIVAESVFNENRLSTINRIRLSNTGESIMIATKISLGILIAIFQTILVYAYSSLVLGVNWGENTIKFIILFITFGVFASVVGALIGLVSKKETTSMGALNAITIVICALGGCYTPMQMMVSIPVLNKLLCLSPIYWINNATTTLMCGGDSKAYIIALVIPIALSILCLIMYAIISKKGAKTRDV